MQSYGFRFFAAKYEKETTIIPQLCGMFQVKRKPTKYRLTVSLCYWLLGIPLGYALKDYVYSVDNLLYLNIARKYAAGNLPEAINFYWSPLISWLCAPLLPFFNEPLYAFKCVQLGLGSLALHFAQKLLAATHAPDGWQWLAGFALVPVLLSYALCFGTPDLLLLSLLLYYLWQLHRQSQLRGWTGAVRMGVTGASLYFAKGFGLPFFLAHFTLVSVFEWRKSLKKRAYLRQYVRSMGVFALLSLLWVGVLYWKYERVLTSAAGGYNLSLSAPENYGIKNRSRHPIDYEGLRPPAYPQSFTLWEDQGTYPYKKWNPLASRADAEHYVFVLMKRNILSIYYGYFRRHTGAIALLLWAVLGFANLLHLARRGKFISSRNFAPNREDAGALRLAWLCASVFMVYNFGYIMVFVISRYLWINEILFLLLAFIAAARLYKIGAWAKYVALILLVLQLGLTTKRSVKTLIFQKDADLTAQHFSEFAQSPIVFLSKNFAKHTSFHQAIKTLAAQRNLKGKIANQINVARRGFFLTAYTAFYSGGKHYGQLTNEIVQNESLGQLHENDIDFYFLWERSPLSDSPFAALPLVYENDTLGLRILSVKPFEK